ncbi:MAG TPA: zinc-dependent metalloprotease [Longimicrobiaceae bacterium]|nr:zinc-dependent metalloprotease [Longimicrobiaceae bacterium]
MTRRFTSAACATVLALAILLAGPANLTAQDSIPSIAEKTEGMTKMDGFMPLYWDADAGKLWMEIARFNEELIYVSSLPAGVGSNDIGLDRGQLGGERIVYFERVGPKILMVQPNYRFRATGNNAAEKKSVEDAFAKSILWGFKVAAETDGRVLVDATDFALRDVHDVIGTLEQTDQGSFKLDPTRSALYLERTKAFPENTEIEATLTFVGDSEGRFLRSVVPTPDAVTVREHHSFVKLPEPGFQMRLSDPRAGYFGIEYEDYSKPLGVSMTQRFISHHRLQKKDPTAAVSEAVEPIIYYLDPGVPEPVRSALLDGARWWNQAFEAAGYKDAFQVKILPEDADPMDLRYNVIQWVHRSTRGWSYGSSITDPRTGEILKGHVSLDSRRARQDYLLAEGLISPYTDPNTLPPEMEALAVARIRQLSAHEVGHTLGIAHNYIASTQGNASVMDYPHPNVTINEDGTLNISNAYDDGIGEWDKVAIAYGYQDFPEGVNEEEALDQILAEARQNNLTFLSDGDARPTGSAHPRVHLWDDGVDATTELQRVMEVRRIALDNFGEAAIRYDRPLATLEEALVPTYLHHRYQVEAAVKTVGGLYYTYAVRGDGQDPLRAVPADEQMRALEAVVATLDPTVLTLPEEVLELIPPRPYGFGMHRELFDRYTGITFDAIAPSVAASELVISLVLQPERAARLVEQHALDESMPGLAEVVSVLADATFGADVDGGYEAAVNRASERVFVEELMRLAYTAPMPQVQAVATLALTELAIDLQQMAGTDDASERAHALLLAQDIQRYLERPYAPERRTEVLAPPPGSPIGG